MRLRRYYQLQGECLQDEVKALAKEICSLPEEERLSAFAFLEDVASALGLEV